MLVIRSRTAAKQPKLIGKRDDVSLLPRGPRSGLILKLPIRLLALGIEGKIANQNRNCCAAEDRSAGRKYIIAHESLNYLRHRAIDPGPQGRGACDVCCKPSRLGTRVVGRKI